MPFLPVLLLLTACADPNPTESAPASCEGDDGEAVEIVVAPYVQSVGADRAWVLWETQGGNGSRVDFGEGLSRTACGALLPLLPGADPEELPTRVHEVELTGLPPDTLVEYRVRTGATEGETLRFRTAPADPEAATTLVVVADTQHDPARMDTWREVAQDGVLDHMAATRGGTLAESVDALLLPGDLVDNGWVDAEWRTEFFAPAAPLAAQIPIYPALGNHDGESPHYFRYFHLPENGDAERSYTFDRANLRVVGLDSNEPFAGEEQLAWLGTVLDDACTTDTVDFVLVQQHHPYLSELWPHGESSWTAQVVARMDSFANACGKPVVNLYGHTHGYGRGASPDAPHLFVNVASGGGAIDRWGDDAQRDYPEFSVAQDTWGFVILDVTAGDAPSLHLQRVSRGNSDAPADNTLTDEVTIPRYGSPPATPAVLSATASCDAVELRSSAYQDADGQPHAMTRWQASTTCADFSAPLVDRLRQGRNEWKGVDLQLGDDLTDEAFTDLPAGTELCVRVQYRDEGLAWSAWSEPALSPPAGCPG